MAPEVAQGTITEAELTALSGIRKDRKHYEKSAQGYRDQKSPELVLEAATDLAEALAESGGYNTPEAEFARAEVVRVRGQALAPQAA
ncbi:MAG: hypothetical protein R2839_08165 [Thermomicrobiales bacterium]